MIINSKKRLSKKYTYLTTVAVVVIVGAITYVYAFNGNLFGWKANSTSKSPINYEKPTDEQIKAGEDIKQNSVNGSDTKQNTNTGSQTPAPQTGTPKKKVEAVITAANQNNGILQIRSQIYTVTNIGQCTLTLLSKADQLITKTAEIQALASTSTCKGFDVPITELASGQWQATVTYENDTLIGTASKVITIQ